MKYAISPNVKLDLERLIETRLLITASSGHGKSMTIRTLLETTHGKVPQIVLDVEGEFSTLREKFDYILAGKGGDIPADPRTAQLFARKLLELNASAIIDLYELKHSDKHRFVRLFIEALVDAPKELWGPRLVVIDEAHQFCPEKGSGSSEAWEAVIDIEEKGRKRGLCPILATQRLSKLSKDAAAECQNKIIGLANIDIDRERSARELGFTHREDILSLRDLEAGEFYVVGPAISKTVQKTKINLASTSHPKIGKRILKAPVATAKVRLLLEKLKDLPQEAEQELKTSADLRGKIKELEQKLREVPKPVKVIEKANTEAIRREVAKVYADSCRKWQEAALAQSRAAWEAFKDAWVPPVMDIAKFSTHPPIAQMVPETRKAIMELAHKVAENTLSKEAVRISEEYKINAPHRKILQFLAIQPRRAFSRIQLGVMTGYSPSGGTFGVYLSGLTTAGLIVKNGDYFQLADLTKTIEILGSDYRPEGKGSLEDWLNKLGAGPSKIYRVLLNSPTTSFTREELGTTTGYNPAGGTFGVYLSELTTLGLMVRNGKDFKLNPEIQGL